MLLPFFSAPCSKSVTKRLNCHYHFVLPPLFMVHNENDVFTASPPLLFSLFPPRLASLHSQRVGPRSRRQHLLRLCAVLWRVCVILLKPLDPTVCSNCFKTDIAVQPLCVKHAQIQINHNLFTAF